MDETQSRISGLDNKAGENIIKEEKIRKIVFKNEEVITDLGTTLRRITIASQTLDKERKEKGNEWHVKEEVVKNFINRRGRI